MPKYPRCPVHIIVTALSMFYLIKNSFRNPNLILKIAHNVKVSHNTISNWCKKFALSFNHLSLGLMPSRFGSEERIDSTLLLRKSSLSLQQTQDH